MAAASPSPFSPNPGGPQMSPAKSDHASRVGTPIDNPNGYLQPGIYGQPYGQHYNPAQYAQPMSAFGNNVPMNPYQYPVQQAIQPGSLAPQRAQQMHIQTQAQAQAQIPQIQTQTPHPHAIPPNNAINQTATANGPLADPHNASMSSIASAPQHGRNQLHPEAFAWSLQAFMHSRGLPVNVMPVICGRMMQAMQLFFSVVKAGGSARITKLNQWSLIAQNFGFAPPEIEHAAHELREYWSRNLATYETAWIAKQQRPNQPMRHPSADSDSQQFAHPQMSPGHDFGDFGSQQNDVNSSTQHSSTPQPMPRNGFLPPSQLKNSPSRQSQPPHQHRPTSARASEENSMNGLQYPPAKRLDHGHGKTVAMKEQEALPSRHPLQDPFKPEVLSGSENRFHGPVDVDEMMTITHPLLDIKPVVPTVRELGTINIHALNMSLKSGLTAEVRLALDTLITLSLDSHVYLSLDACDDLLETLIDCANDQIELLAKEATEVSDEMLISPYEDVLRSCRLESELVQGIHEMGSDEYELDRAVDRLVCITTLIRNFSFFEPNFVLLGMPELVRMLTTVIKHLGTKEMFLRTHRNTLDFMKDVVVYLNNLSHSIQLPGRDEALCLLHFLLSFAPGPPPNLSAMEGVMFASYNPNVHKYTPSAVQSLAKLFARDEPNRDYYRSILSNDGAFSPTHDLLTRTFGLAISPLPRNSKGPPLALVEARKPFLLQGLLAAEIVADLTPPGSDTSNIARLWLSSKDGFAMTLLRLVQLLASFPRPSPHPLDNPQTSQQQQRGVPLEPDADAVGAIMHRGIAVLRRLAEKSQAGGNEYDGRRPSSLRPPIPRRENLVGALTSQDLDPHMIRQLCLYAGVEV